MVPPGPLQENRLEKFRRQKTGELAEKQADLFLSFPSQSAFLEEGAPRVNRNKRRKRQRTAAPIEVAEGGTILWPPKNGSPAFIILFLPHEFDKRRVDGL